VLLTVDAAGSNWSDEQTAEVFSCTSRTVSQLRQRFVEQGLEAALERKKREQPARAPLLDGEQEARLIHLAFSEPPTGYARPHRRTCWVIPPKQNAEFVAAMEDVLEVYRRPYDPKRPVVCLDEQPVQLVRETRYPIPAKPDQPERYDSETGC